MGTRMGHGIHASPRRGTPGGPPGIAGCGLLLLAACTQSRGAAPADASPAVGDAFVAVGDASVAVGDAFVAVGDASPAVGACPKGPPPTYPSGCPPTLPESGSCCAAIGAECFYPTGGDMRRSLAICTEDSVRAPFWLVTYVLDRENCKSSTDAVQLGGASATACADRASIPCHACNCPPSDSLCASRCGAPSGRMTPQEQLDSDFANLIHGCGDLGWVNFTFQADFVAGCATSLIAQLPGPSGTYDPMIACIAGALDNVHFECADSLQCAIVHFSTLPP
jgi:hypothetical protein